MGIHLSRQNGLADGEDINSSSVYRYPPKSGEDKVENSIAQLTRAPFAYPGTDVT